MSGCCWQGGDGVTLGDYEKTYICINKCNRLALYMFLVRLQLNEAMLEYVLCTMYVCIAHYISYI